MVWRSTELKQIRFLFARFQQNSRALCAPHETGRSWLDPFECHNWNVEVHQVDYYRQVRIAPFESFSWKTRMRTTHCASQWTFFLIGQTTLSRSTNKTSADLFDSVWPYQSNLWMKRPQTKWTQSKRNQMNPIEKKPNHFGLHQIWRMKMPKFQRLDRQRQMTYREEQRIDGKKWKTRTPKVWKGTKKARVQLEIEVSNRKKHKVWVEA